MSILSGPEIIVQRAHGRILIDPFNVDQINPASYDLRLGKKVLWYRNRLLDSASRNEVEEVEFPDSGHIIHSGRLYLMHTVERIYTERFVPVLDGKSSVGRLGVQIHITAGYGDPGFDGQYTLEVICVHPVKLYPNMRIAQMRFHQMEGRQLSYKDSGHYKGEAAMGPVPSLSWKQFERKQ
jgi:dCTP deaminase